MSNFITIELVTFLASIGLAVIGIYIALTDKNLIKVIIGLNLADSGVNIFIVFSGYIKNKTAPIFSKAYLVFSDMVDPLPQALVLTAIVIGFGVTALSLAIVIRLYKHYGTLDISKIRGLKW